MAQVEAVDLQPVAPLGEVGLGRVARCRVARETRGDDQLGAGAQQLQAGLVADLHAAAGEQRHAPAQVGQLAALGVVERGALGAQLVVEEMDRRIFLLAHVAVFRLDRLAWLRGIGLGRNVVRQEAFRHERVRRGEHRLAPQRADAGLVQHGLLGLDLAGMARLLGRLQLDPACHRVGMVDPRHRLVQALAVVCRQLVQQLAVGRHRFQQCRRGAQALQQRGIRVVGQGRGGRRDRQEGHP